MIAAGTSLASAAPNTPPASFVAVDSITAVFSHTADADLRHGNGEVGVQRYELEAGGRTTSSSGANWTHSLGFARTELEAPVAALLPEYLQELALKLGWQFQSGPRWRFMATVRPGFYGDGSSIQTDTFNAPVLALASYASSRDLVWSFGVVANAFSDNPVLPVAGVRWQFAPEWIFNVGLPRTGVEWTISQDITLTAGATVQGGAYKTTRAPRGASGVAAARLTDTEFDYREVRVGLGAEFKVTEALRLNLDAGVSVDQRFEYHEAGVEQRGDSALFIAVAVTGRF